MDRLGKLRERAESKQGHGVLQAQGLPNKRGAAHLAAPATRGESMRDAMRSLVLLVVPLRRRLWCWRTKHWNRRSVGVEVLGLLKCCSQALTKDVGSVHWSLVLGWALSKSSLEPRGNRHDRKQ